MKKISKLTFILFVILIFFPLTVLAHTEADPFVTDLTVGGGNIKTAMDVGDVLVWNDGENLYVKYLVTDEDWCLTDTHLEVATALEDIPQQKGNPIPGQFTYAGQHDCVAGVTYSIPLSWTPGTELLIAAHGVVQTGSGDGLLMLPDMVSIAVTYPGNGFGAPSYFDIAVSGGTTLDGTYDGYCVDLDSGFVSALANVYSSYGDLPSSIDYPENMDFVNWIINQGFVGQDSACDGAYTYGDVQWAIWRLLEDDDPTPGALGSLGDWSECRAQEILAAAYANGAGFVPGCGDMIVIILQPVVEDVEKDQPVIIWVDVPCGEQETAWGGDYFGTPLEFPGKSWAIYFAYTVQ